MELIDRSALLPYTTDEIYALVSDILTYPEFLPWCSGTEILSQEGEELSARIGFSVGGVSQSFTTRNRLQPGKEIAMQLVDGPFSQLEGRWRFEPLGDAGCKISLLLEYDFSSKMVSLVVGPVFNKIANTLVDAFQKRAVEVYGER
ncbi:MAG TPA: type II toxin-antitoxin system RatA family toxin [Gammaproteobacteria bacterium]|nr:type II toxin-antitoxin system RatA family toxin [Gammaproteobacteria bacterium]